LAHEPTPKRDAVDAAPLSRRAAAVGVAVAAATVGFGEERPSRAIPRASLVWQSMEGVPEEAQVFGQIEASPEWSVDFIIYLSRILLNYDEESAAWWQQDVLPSVPADASRSVRAAALREKFADFTASVEFGLRRYLVEGRRASGVLKKLVDKYGQNDESRRHLALAFTLLEDQPLDLIATLLGSLRPEGRLQAVFSPALPEYLAMDPKRLLPNTQFPVWDGGVKRWVIPGLRAATPYSTTLDDREALQSVFGPRGTEVVFTERSLEGGDYVRFALSGAFGCAFTHSLVIPLDVVKTRMQTKPGMYKGLLEGAVQLQREEGIPGLILGWQPTLLGYLWYGITVYPGYEFFKRFFIAVAGPAIVESFRVPLVLLAGAAATVFACIGVCPAEACRIRMVADESLRGCGLPQVVGTIAAQDGVGYFYDGLGTILVRQVLFGMMKFLVFDYFADFVLDLFPVLAEQVATQLLVSLLSGAVAGVVSSIVSQPADTVLSKMNQAVGRKSFLEVGAEIYKEAGLGGFFLGLNSRCVWAGCIISGQFFLYDVCKSLLGVKDLRVFLDVQI